MKAPARLGLYGLILVAVFTAAGLTANAVIPEDTVRAWVEESAEGHGAGHGDGADTSSLGLGLAQDGYQLTSVSAPAGTGEASELTFAVTGPDGNRVTDFDLDHEQEMHLIAVRADGQHFAHVHPEKNQDGTWSIPWQWEAAGTYRIFADFVPAQSDEGITLSTAVQVSGDFEPVAAEQAVQTTFDGFDVTVEGDLVAGSASELTFMITRYGEPVTSLEPYLGAFGHLVALRDGDLAYLHAHPHGGTSVAGETSGPEIVFEATAPTEGRYLLYLDFQVDAQAHTASLVIDATGNNSDGASSGDSENDEHEQGEGHDD
ncbi:heavy metal-binding domain-containing protein [Dietzia natronolimnaea]|uniref:Heavy metal-binding domain-containing protein n=1 Tax=Dietzia natronolimnaea TaxID=161920 RepID=A0A2A2WQT3_9ACTN|nr:heavy metal-binding domain-containing protein [Dietzia natronolimnaea]PAY23566.1 heavy metal-binding domain-containing protein [Dietzia natronolimnaea]